LLKGPRGAKSGFSYRGGDALNRVAVVVNAGE